MSAIRKHFRNSEKKTSFVVYLYNTAHDIIQSVFLYLQASSVAIGTKLRAGQKKEQTLDLRPKKKERFLVSSAPTTRDLELIQPHTKRTLGILLMGKVAGNRS